MMFIKRILPSATSFFGYLLYTLAVLLFLLWYKFPADAVKIRVEQDLNRMNPALRWDVGQIRFFPPAAVQLNDIRISGTKKKEHLLTVNALSLRPNLLLWKKTGELAARYRLHLLDGTVSGQLRMTKDHAAISYDGDIKEVKIDGDRLEKLLQEYDRTVSLVVSGSFTGGGSLSTHFVNTAQGRLRLGKGIISLQEPVLGMERLEFDQATAKVLYDDSGILHIEEGTMTSRSLSSEFSGTLHPVTPCALSKIRLQGSLEPRPEFLASIGNPILVELVKRQLMDDGLPFTINGTLREPGIV
ncbi:MAG: type II secretion system protein GspN, partial [Candidatus Electrothrix sp. AR4]|nr:type II secretion system protein GspN [Candidatus Electrothrix sp. AR4]